MKVSLNITPEFSPAQVISPDKQFYNQITSQQEDSRFSLFIDKKNATPVNYKLDRMDKAANTETPSENGLKAGQGHHDGHSINNRDIHSQDSNSKKAEGPDQHIGTVRVDGNAEETGRAVTADKGLKAGILLNQENEELPSAEKEQAQNSLKLGNLLHSLRSDSDDALLNINPAVLDEVEIEGESIQEGTEEHSEQGLKIGELLYGLMNNYTGELQPDALAGPADVKGGDAAEAETVQTNTGTTAESGLKTGSLLYNLVSNYAEGIEGKLQGEAVPVEGINNEDTSSGTAAEKTAPAVSQTEGSPSIITAVEGSAEEPSSGIPAEKTAPVVGKTEGSLDIITAVEGDAEEPGSGAPAEKGLKAGSLLNQEIDVHTEEADAPEEGEIDLAKSSSEKPVSTMDKASKASETEHVETKDEPYGRKAVSEAVLKEIKSVQADDNGDIQDIQDDINISKITAGKVSSETSKNNSDNILRNYMSVNAKAIQTGGEGSETGNGNLMNNSNMSSEGGRHAESLFHQNSARPAGFNELLNDIMYVARGNNKLGVTLEHELFGKLNINLSLNKGVVNVHINTADNSVKEYIENNIQSIVDALADEDVSVGGFSVGLKGRKNHEGASTTDVNKSGEFLQEMAGPVNNRGLVNIFV
jgi:flagellar hook-length control protein FliK